MLFGKVAFLISVIAQIVIRYPYRNSRKRTQVDRQEQILLTLLSIGGLLLPLIYIFTGWLAFADYTAPVWVVGVGVVIMAVGLWLFWRAHIDLGRNWSNSLDIHTEHRLITEIGLKLVKATPFQRQWMKRLQL
jgi:protein-S-isoprenylcysteine O-methyltransferase Ste14